MQPYYQQDGITLYHGDCLQITEWLTADVLVTDPPYGMNYQSGKRPRPLDKIGGDQTTELRDNAIALWGPRPAIVFGTWRAPRPTGTRTVGIWDKTDGAGPGMGDLNMPFGSSHEEFYLLGPWTLTGKRRGSVIRTAISMGGPGHVTKTGHPTAKPIQVLETLLQSCPPGATIADPFAGAGSTLLAARNQGRQAIGIELEERYCELTAQRLDQGILTFT